MTSGSWSGTSRIENLPTTFRGITVFWPLPLKAPSIPTTQRFVQIGAICFKCLIESYISCFSERDTVLATTNFSSWKTQEMQIFCHVTRKGQKTRFHSIIQAKQPGGKQGTALSMTLEDRKCSSDYSYASSCIAHLVNCALDFILLAIIISEYSWMYSIKNVI